MCNLTNPAYNHYTNAFNRFGRSTDQTSIFRIFDDFFEDCPSSDVISKTANFPVSRVFINKDADQLFEIAITGFAKDEVSVAVKSNTLIVSGTKKSDPEKEGWEFVTGKLKSPKDFKVHYRISSMLDAERADVTFKNGMLSVFIPHKTAFDEKKIEIK